MNTTPPIEPELQTFIDDMLKASRPKYYSYYGELDLNVWGTTPFTQHRDSDLIEQSNFDNITKTLIAQYPDDFVIERSSHFLVGWVEYLRCNTASLDAVQAAYTIQQKLDAYFVYNEDDLSTREDEDRCNSIDNWAMSDFISYCEKHNINVDEDGFYIDITEDSKVHSAIWNFLYDKLCNSGGESINQDRWNTQDVEELFTTP